MAVGYQDPLVFSRQLESYQSPTLPASIRQRHSSHEKVYGFFRRLEPHCRDHRARNLTRAKVSRRKFFALPKNKLVGILKVNFFTQNRSDNKATPATCITRFWLPFPSPNLRPLPLPLLLPFLQQKPRQIFQHSPRHLPRLLHLPLLRPLPPRPSFQRSRLKSKALSLRLSRRCTSSLVLSLYL